jgi:hypothetical protein
MGKARDTFDWKTYREKTKDNVTTNTSEMKWEGGHRINFIQEKDQWQTFLNMAMNFRYHEVQRLL